MELKTNDDNREWNKIWIFFGALFFYKAHLKNFFEKKIDSFFGGGHHLA